MQGHTATGTKSGLCVLLRRSRFSYCGGEMTAGKACPRPSPRTQGPRHMLRRKAPHPLAPQGLRAQMRVTPPNRRSAEEPEPWLLSPSTMSTLISPVSAVSLSKGPFRSGSASQAGPALGGRSLTGQT